MSKLAVVDDQGNVVGKEGRSYIHTNGLLHRVAHVWFFDGQGNIIVQKRSMASETYPGFYDATVGGHVELGMDGLGTAIKECEEETGIKLTETDLTFLGRIKGSGLNGINHLYDVYAHEHNDGLETLSGPAEEVGEFIKIPFAELTSHQTKFCPGLMEEPYLRLLAKIPTLPSA